MTRRIFPLMILAGAVLISCAFAGCGPKKVDRISSLQLQNENLKGQLQGAQRRQDELLEDKQSLSMDLDEARRVNENHKLSMDPFLSVSREEAMSVFGDTKSYDRGQYIFKEGDNADGAYYIVEGKVKVVSSSTFHEQVILDELGEDEIFGEMSLIDNKPRSATIITATPCKIAFIDKQEFNEFIENRYELSFKLMACICLSLFWRILRLDKLYSDVKKTLQ